MGAPGNFILCPDGHVIGVIEDDLYGEFDDKDSIWNYLEKLKNSRCKECGKMAFYSFCHYGDINDCLDDDSKLEWDSVFNKYIIPENFKEKGMNIIKRKNERVTVISDESINLLLERLKSAHVILIDSDKIGNVKIPEVDEKILYNIIRGGE